MKPYPIGADWIMIEETPRDSFMDEAPGGVLHAMPTNDIAEHEISIKCWCQPELDNREMMSGDEIVAHRYMRKALQ